MHAQNVGRVSERAIINHRCTLMNTDKRLISFPLTWILSPQGEEEKIAVMLG